MKKLLTGILAGFMIVSAGCAKKEEMKTEEEIISMISGDLDLSGVWEDEKDENLKVIFVSAGENEYDVMGTWGKTSSEAESWNMHGTYDPSSGMLAYQDGDYAVLKMTPEGTEVRENEKKVSGSFCKIGTDVISWNDDALSGQRNLKHREDSSEGDPESTEGPRLRFAEGPFTVSKLYREALTEEEKERFEKGVLGQIAVGYEPVQVLASQTVNGVNYAYLAYGTFVLSGTQETYCIIVIHEDPDGSTELLHSEVLDVNDPKLKDELSGEALLGAWEVSDNEADGLISDEVDEAFFKAMETADDSVAYTVPIALLGTAEDGDAVTYRMLVRGSAESIYPKKALFVFDVEKKADQTCSVISCKPLDLAAYVSPNE